MAVLLSGCRSGPDGPVRVRVTQGDIQVTFTSARYIYDSSGMDPEAPLDFEVRIDPSGADPEEVKGSIELELELPIQIR